MIELEEPGVYNKILRKLKEKLLKGELGGERKDFWYEVRKSKLGLVDKKASERSDVGEDEARQVSIVAWGHRATYRLIVDSLIPLGDTQLLYGSLQLLFV